MKLFKLILIVSTAALFSSFVILEYGKREFQSRKPNILFIINDDAGLDFSAYGSTFVQTPAFDKIAKEGLLFNKAYTPNAKCSPSRSCILTGRNSWQLDAACNHSIYFPTHYLTFSEALKNNGYEVGLTGKGWGPGKSLTVEGKQRELIGKSYDEFHLIPPTSKISKIDYAENFRSFLNLKKDKPWFFWVGFHEPHRAYEYGSGVKKAKKNISVITKIPTYLPESDSVKNDFLDYAYEIENADGHVAKILEYLKQSGQLDNTIIVYTSDHGRPFPRMKGNQYEHSNHIPLAIKWNSGIKYINRKIDDYISFIDLAPTILEAAGISIKTSKMQPITGKSLFSIFNSSKSGQVVTSRDYVLVGQERHDVGRPNDEGYPIRGIHKNNMLYLRNFEPERWPVCNPETGYLNCDGGVTKSYILNQRRNGLEKKYWKLCFGHRPMEELYDIKNDPDCVKNLIDSPAYKLIKNQMSLEMIEKLKKEGDLRMSGFGYLYESFPQSTLNNFYERFMKGEKMNTNWVEDTDFEKGIIEDN